MEKFDVIIIGGGLGGLECGVILSREGWNVCVLEKNGLLGGCLQTFYRYGYRLDTGLHYFGGMEEGHTLRLCFDYFGITGRLHLKKMDEECFDRIWYGGRFYDFSSGFDRFAETLAGDFPDQKDGVRKLVAEIRDTGDSISPEAFKAGLPGLRSNIGRMSVSASGRIGGLISDSVLRNVLAGTSLLYGGAEHRSSFYEYAMIMYSFIQGAYRCAGGSMQIADALADVISKNGGTVLTNSEVTEILAPGGTVSGVRTRDGRVFEAGHVISDVHPAVTLKLIARDAGLRPAYRKRIEGLENTCGIYKMYLMMEPGTCPYINSNLYFHSTGNVWYDNRSRTPDSCMLSMQAPLSGDCAEVVSLLTPMHMDELRRWENTLPEGRGGDYLEFKKFKDGQILEILRACGYEIKGQVSHTLSVTPLSYRDYTGTVDGSAYGILKDYHDPPACMIAPVTKFGNLLLTGQNLNMHGILGVTMTSIMTCSELLGLKYLTQKIAYE